MTNFILRFLIQRTSASLALVALAGALGGFLITPSLREPGTDYPMWVSMLTMAVIGAVAMLVSFGKMIGDLKWRKELAQLRKDLLNLEDPP